MEYNIIKSSEHYDLRQSVEMMIEDGWKPQGGVAIYNGWYCQAMIKEDDE